MSIFITGATGRLGGLVIKELLKKIDAGSVVACVRNPEKAASLKDRGVHVRSADYDRFDSLQAAFAGAEKLLFVSSPDIDDTKRALQHAAVVLAAKRAGVKHLLYTSFAFAEESRLPIAALHLATEYMIRTTGIPYTFLRNALYTDEAFVTPGLNAAVAAGEIASNCRRGKINSLSRADLARATAAALTGEGHRNKTYNLVSTRLWDYPKLARVLSEASGKDIVFRPVSEVEEKRLLLSAGLPEGAAEFMASLYERVAEGEAARKSGDFELLAGRPEPLADVVKRALGASPSIKAA